MFCEVKAKTASRGREKFASANLFVTTCPTSIHNCWGGEMVDTPVLGTGAVRHGGSSPLLRTRMTMSFDDGDYGVTVNTGVCGTLDSGSIPDSRPRLLYPQCMRYSNRSCLCKPGFASLAPAAFGKNKSKLSFSPSLAGVAQVVRAQHS